MVSVVHAKPSKLLKGVVSVPGDKSISHRALMIGSQAIGQSKVVGLLEGEDVLSTLHSLQAMGVTIERDSESPEIWLVNGVGVGGLAKPEGDLDLGNAGTGVRLLMGLVASHGFDCRFVGDASLSSRPMKRVVAPLEIMGVEIESAEGCRLPIILKGGELTPISYYLPVPSAQVKSAVLLAGLNSPGVTEVIEDKLTRDHTERMLRFFGARVDEHFDKQGAKHICLHGRPELKAQDIVVPGDPSSAAFLVVAALLVPGSELEVQNICYNPQRIGLYETLKEMGADITFVNSREMCGEEVVDMRVKYSKLKGVEVPADRAPSMIDEYPILSVAAAFAEGKTVMSGVEELKVKESNRLSAIAEGLEKCGVNIEVGTDHLTVYGSEDVLGAEVPISTYMDHRIAMSFLIMGLAAEKGAVVDDGTMIDTSFPGFISLINSIGGELVSE